MLFFIFAVSLPIEHQMKRNESDTHHFVSIPSFPSEGSTALISKMTAEFLRGREEGNQISRLDFHVNQRCKIYCNASLMLLATHNLTFNWPRETPVPVL